MNILGGTLEKPVTVLTNTIPAGSYIVWAKSTISTVDEVIGDKWTAQCQLSDVPTSGASTFDSSNATGEVITNFLFHTGHATVPLGMAISTSTASTLTLACTHVWDVSGKTRNVGGQFVPVGSADLEEQLILLRPAPVSRGCRPLASGSERSQPSGSASRPDAIRYKRH